MMLLATAEIEVEDGERFLRPICDHLAEHGATIETAPSSARVRFGAALGEVRVSAGRMKLSATAPDVPSLLMLRSSLAAHLKEFAGTRAGPIVWTGDAAGATEPPEFRMMRVEAVRDLTPRMRRIELVGEDLGRFATLDHLHCKLLFPSNGIEPVWPVLGSDGLIRWPDGRHKLTVRKYTIRQIDVAAGRMTIDFVRHPDSGPGSRFAEEAAVGQRLGLIGPGGGSTRPADFTLLAGDETALPAMARILEVMPADASGLALFEVADADEVLTLQRPAGVEVRWLLRDGRPAGTTNLLETAIAAVELPIGRGIAFIWVGCEFTAYKAIRRQVRSRLALDRSNHLVVPYWRAGAK